MLISLLPLLSLLSLGCQSDSGFHKVEEAAGPGENQITGRVCDPELLTWKEGAQIYTHLADATGFIYDTRVTTSDIDGYWTLSEMPGDVDYEIYVVVDNIIVDSFLVHLAEGQHAVLDEPNCFQDLDLDVAVISGDYDDFGALLSQIGVIEYDIIDGQTGEELEQFLLNPDTLLLYDVVFFNGGHLEEDIFYDSDDSLEAGPGNTVTQIQSNLIAYAESGGMIYSSDWSYDVIESVWPDKIDFLGDDLVPDDAQRGDIGSVRATVADMPLKNALGTETLDVVYDLAVWPPVESVGLGVTTYLSGKATWRDGDEVYEVVGSPLLMSFEAGDGLVVYSTYRNESNTDTQVFDILRYLLDKVQ